MREFLKTEEALEERLPAAEVGGWRLGRRRRSGDGLVRARRLSARAGQLLISTFQRGRAGRNGATYDHMHLLPVRREDVVRAPRLAALQRLGRLCRRVPRRAAAQRACAAPAGRIHAHVVGGGCVPVRAGRGIGGGIGGGVLSGHRGRMAVDHPVRAHLRLVVEHGGRGVVRAFPVVRGCVDDRRRVLGVRVAGRPLPRRRKADLPRARLRRRIYRARCTRIVLGKERDLGLRRVVAVVRGSRNRLGSCVARPRRRARGLAVRGQDADFLWRRLGIVEPPRVGSVRRRISA